MHINGRDMVDLSNARMVLLKRRRIRLHPAFSDASSVDNYLSTHTASTHPRHVHSPLLNKSRIDLNSSFSFDLQFIYISIIYILSYEHNLFFVLEIQKYFAFSNGL